MLCPNPSLCSEPGPASAMLSPVVTREGYAVTLVARRSEPLDRLANDLTSAGATAHVITANLSDTA